MASLTFKSPAKLNLFLHIVGQREDGYHELETLFQLIDYSDELGFEVNTTGQVNLKLSGEIAIQPSILPAENLIFKAARLLQTSYHIPDGCNISVYKKIPMGAGLGGGSSNAATTLLVLNKLWGLHLPIQTLTALGLQLGADVPLFIRGYSSFATGIGDSIHPVELKEQWYLILSPPCMVSTRAIFSHQELTRNTEKLKIRAFWPGMGKNDCEAVVTELYPPVREALDWLLQFGDARLTGTGSCVFAPFDTQSEALKVLKLVKQPRRGFIARGVNVSPLHQRLEQVDQRWDDA